MATIKTTKPIDPFELHTLLGGDLSDVSTTPRIVGEETRIQVDDEGNEVEVVVPILEGIPLDSKGEKTITATVKGDGETPITEAELRAAIERCADVGAAEAAREAAKTSATAKLRKLGLTDEEIEALRS